MNILKDIYEYLTNFADDRTILNMLSTNKKFRDEEMFEKIMRRRYPFLIKYKIGRWSELYIQAIYYIQKIQEEFGIPYIPTEDYNPKGLYINQRNSFLNEAIDYAVKGGHTDIVKLIIEKGDPPLQTAMNKAAEEGYIDIIKLFIEKGEFKPNFNLPMLHAAESGHIDIVKLMIEKGVKNNKILNLAMTSASEEGYTDIVNLIKGYLYDPSNGIKENEKN